MKFLADESCDFTVVRALRGAGYDVVSITEVEPLFFSHGSHSEGVVLFRYPAGTRKRFSQDVVGLAKLHGSKLKGCFVVVEPGRVRIRRREDQ